MDNKKTVGILCAILLVAAFVTVPAFDHAFASKIKSIKNTSDKPHQKNIVQKNTKTESRHKKMHKSIN